MNILIKKAHQDEFVISRRRLILVSPGDYFDGNFYLDLTNILTRWIRISSVSISASTFMWTIKICTISSFGTTRCWILKALINIWAAYISHMIFIPRLTFTSKRSNFIDAICVYSTISQSSSNCFWTFTNVLTKASL